MSSRQAGPGLSVALSVAVHALLAGLFALGLWQFHSAKPPTQQLAIEATVVDGSRLAMPAARPPVPENSPQSETVPPADSPAAPAEPPAAADNSVALDQQAREQAAHELAARQQQLQQQQDRQAKAARDAKAAKDAKVLKEAKDAKEAKALKDVQLAKAAKEAKAAEEAKLAKQAQELRDRQAREAHDKQQREQQAREQQAREQQARAVNEAELRARMAAEERQLAAQNSGLLAQYQAQIRARIERAWIRPPTARPGLSCEVRITQVPGGEVVGVRVGNCNGDESVRQSIEAAAYRASPLPLPPDPSLFDRNLLVTFKPQD